MKCEHNELVDGGVASHGCVPCGCVDVIKTRADGRASHVDDLISLKPKFPIIFDTEVAAMGQRRHGIDA